MWAARLCRGVDLAAYYQRLTCAKDVNKFCDQAEALAKRQSMRRSPSMKAGSPPVLPPPPAAFSPARGAIPPGSVRNLKAAFESAAVLSTNKSGPTSPAGGAAPGSFSRRQLPGSSGNLRTQLTTSFGEMVAEVDDVEPLSPRRGVTAAGPAALRRVKSTAESGMVNRSASGADLRRQKDESEAAALGAMTEAEKARLARRMSKWNLPLPRGLQQPQVSSDLPRRASTPLMTAAGRTSSMQKQQQQPSSPRVAAALSMKDLKRVPSASASGPSTARAANVGSGFAVSREEAERLYMEAVLEAELSAERR